MHLARGVDPAYVGTPQSPALDLRMDGSFQGPTLAGLPQVRQMPPPTPGRDTHYIIHDIGVMTRRHLTLKSVKVSRHKSILTVNKHSRCGPEGDRYTLND